MEINRGKIERAKKIIIYGPEGIGKSTFASKFPNALFIDVEGSTADMDVVRTKKPSSWYMLMEQVKHIKNNPDLCDTLVLDTADWAEQLCSNHICAKSNKDGIEDFGYGKGYVYLGEEFGRLLNALEELIEIGINVVITAHAQIRKFEQPDEMGSYDRWELKLQKKTAPLLKEWADMVLLANYKTYVVNVESQGAQKGKNKVQGGKRVMYTTHHPCWDAKNRQDLPSELLFDFKQIAHCIKTHPKKYLGGRSSVAPEPKTDPVVIAPPPVAATSEPITQKPIETKIAETFPNAIKKDKSKQDLSGVPKPLADLMFANNVTVREMQMAVASKGYYPENTPIENYDSNFVSGVLVGAWNQVHEIIRKMSIDPF